MDVRHLVDRELAEMLDVLALPDAVRRFDDLAGQRAQIAKVFASPEPLPGIERAERVVPGDPPVMIRISRPSTPGPPRACLYWMHGGGYVVGNHTMHGAELEAWCLQFDCVAVAVDYRLAPEHPYPAPLEDCYAGLAWVVENASSLGVDATRVGIGGMSAGGGLAAGLALLARDRGEPPVAFQLLLCPMIDDRAATPSSNWENYVWPSAANRAGWQAYLGHLYGRDVPSYAAAARADDLAGLPATLIEVSSLEGFFDENVEYARRLAHAFVPVELHAFPSAPHGYEMLAPTSSIARRARRAIDGWLETKLRVAA